MSGLAEKPVVSVNQRLAATRVKQMADDLRTLLEGRQIHGTATHNFLQAVNALDQEASAVIGEYDIANGPPENGG